MDWQEINLEHLIKPDPERDRRWREELNEIYEAGRAADRDRHKVLASWSSPSGLIPYAKS